MLGRLLTAATRKRAVDAAIAFACGDIDDPQAFESLCRAVRHHLNVRKLSDAEPVARVPFGPKKGQCLSTLTLAELNALERYITASLHDASKKQFRAANLTLRANLLAELHRRSARAA